MAIGARGMHLMISYSKQFKIKPGQMKALRLSRRKPAFAENNKQVKDKKCFDGTSDKEI